MNTLTWQEKFSMIFNSEISIAKKNTSKDRILIISLIYLYAIFYSLIVIVSIGIIEQAGSVKSLFGYSAFEIILTVTILTDLIVRFLIYKDPKHQRRIYKLKFFLKPGTIILMLSLISLGNLIGTFFNYPQIILDNLNFFKLLRIFRIISFLTLVPGIYVLRNVLKKEQVILTTILITGVIVMALSASLVFSIETSEEAIKNVGGKENLKIKTFFDAFYFTTITFTTIGYGDITPVTDMGRILVIIMSITGIALFAVPTGVISGGFITQLKDLKEQKERDAAPEKPQAGGKKTRQSAAKTKQPLKSKSKTTSKPRTVTKPKAKPKSTTRSNTKPKSASKPKTNKNQTTKRSR